jgi:restriction endonuclease S subunit
MHYIQKSLSELATISAGHPIRDAVRDVPGGDVAVVQMRNVHVETGVDWTAVAKTNLSGRREPDWLKPGDVLFSARGQRNIAVCLNQPPLKAVCSPHFFLIRVTDNKSVLPEFLAWQMNLPSAQQYFAQSATGSYIKSIRRKVLERLTILIPSLDRQSLLVGLAKTAQREKEILEQLIENRQQELERIARNLLTQRKRA